MSCRACFSKCCSDRNTGRRLAPARRVAFRRHSSRRLAEAITAGCLGWATYFGAVWIRYAHVRRTRAPGADLDSFIPDPEIEEAHETRVEAPAAICPAPRRSSIFSVLPGLADLRPRTPSPGCAVTRPDGRGQGRRKRPRIGWGVLADVPGQRFVAGAVTRPWEVGDLDADGFAVVFSDKVAERGEVLVEAQAPGFAHGQ